MVLRYCGGPGFVGKRFGGRQRRNDSFRLWPHFAEHELRFADGKYRDHLTDSPLLATCVITQRTDKPPFLKNFISKNAVSIATWCGSRLSRSCANSDFIPPNSRSLLKLVDDRDGHTISLAITKQTRTG